MMEVTHLNDQDHIKEEHVHSAPLGNSENHYTSSQFNELGKQSIGLGNSAGMSCTEIFNVNNKSCQINITFYYDLVENIVT